MRLVGEAVSEYPSFDRKLPVIGVVTWGVISMRDKILNPKKNLNYNKTESSPTKMLIEYIKVSNLAINVL